MDSTTFMILFFVVLLIGGIGAYAFYVNSLLDERDSGKGKKKLKKKDKTNWSIGDM